jgi:sec-independent protein translocase protein TatA
MEFAPRMVAARLGRFPRGWNAFPRGDVLCNTVASSSEAEFMGSLGLPELLVILVIVIVIFGASKLPQLGKGLGEGISNFRDGLSKGRDDSKSLPKSSDDKTA